MQEPQKQVRKPPAKRDKCPDNPVELCKEFMKESAFRWQAWVIDANSAYGRCCMKEPPKPPRLPNTDCTDQEDCEDVCELFEKWAKDIHKWATAFTKAVDKCFDKWEPKVKVPHVPDRKCERCKQACDIIRQFHKKLAEWGEDIRIPLNTLCSRPGPGLVPKPPPPPFE